MLERKKESYHSIIVITLVMLALSNCFKDTVTLETHIQYIAYISYTLIFFPHQIIFSESQINSLSNDIKYLQVVFSRKKKNVQQRFFTLFIKKVITPLSFIFF